MQSAISDVVHLGQIFDPAYNTIKVQSIDYSSNFEHISKKINKLQNF